MRTGHPTRRANLADHLSRLDALAALHADGAQVAVHGHQPFAVIEKHSVAVEEEITGIEHAAIGRCPYGGPRGPGDIHTGMRVARLDVEYTPEAVGAGADAGDGLQQAHGRRRLSGESAQRCANVRLLAL